MLNLCMYVHVHMHVHVSVCYKELEDAREAQRLDYDIIRSPRQVETQKSIWKNIDNKYYWKFLHEKWEKFMRKRKARNNVSG